MQDRIREQIQGNSSNNGFIEPLVISGEVEYRQGYSLYIKNKNIESFSYFTKAAEQGYPPAYLRLWRFYHGQLGITKDAQKAFVCEQEIIRHIAWFQAEAKKGEADAQNNLGLCYENGWGVNKDLTQAIRYFHLAADQGHVVAQNNLGSYYAHGVMVVKDLTKAIAYYRLAVEQGYALAQCNLASCYEKGQGVSQDLIEATKYYQLAADQGNVFAKEYLKKLLKNLSDVNYSQANTNLHPIDLTNETPLSVESYEGLGKRKATPLRTEKAKRMRLSKGLAKNLPSTAEEDPLKYTLASDPKTSTLSGDDELKEAFAKKDLVKINSLLDSYATESVSEDTFIFQDNKKTTIWHVAVPLKNIPLLHRLLEFPAVKLLLDRGDKFGETPLHVAVKNQSIDIVTFLLDQGAEVTRRTSHKKTVLHYAADKKNLSLLSLLMSRTGALPLCGQYDNWQKLPIHSVLHINRENFGRGFVKLEPILAICELLIPHLNEVQIKHLDRYKKTFLHYAVEVLPGKLLEPLLKQVDQATLCLADNYGKTVLHIAAKWGNTEAIALILSNGGKSLINQSDQYGKMPLHEAAIYARIETKKIESNVCAIKLLLEQGATFETKSESGGLSAFEESCNTLGIIETFNLFSPYMNVSKEEKETRFKMLLEKESHKLTPLPCTELPMQSSLRKRSWGELEANNTGLSASNLAIKSRFFTEDATSISSNNSNECLQLPNASTPMSIHFQYDLLQNNVIQACTTLPSQSGLETHPWLTAGNNRESDVDSAKTGKWMLFYPTHQIDSAWETIKRGIQDGNLWQAKVSTAKQSNNHALIVYTKDYTNMEDVIRVHDYLQTAHLVKGIIYYKTNEQTRARVYQGASNHKSWIYSSQTIEELRHNYVNQPIGMTNNHS